MLQIQPLLNLERAQCYLDGVSPVGPQPLAALARPLGPAARSAGPSAGCGTVDYGENRATSGRITHSRFNRGTFGNHGAGSTLFWIDPRLGMTFVCLTAGIMDEGDNIQRFQRLSDIALSAAIDG